MTRQMTNKGAAGSGRVEALAGVARIQLHVKKPRAARRVFPALFIAVLFALFLIALATGVRTYSSVAETQAANSASRTGLDLIANSVRANDATGSVAVGQGPEGRSLVMIENLSSGSYEVRTYLYQGKIVQEYALAGSQYTPESATELVQSSSFDFAFSRGLLAITTDQGTCEVALRNLQGGE